MSAFVVIKLGGSALDDHHIEATLDAVATDVHLLLGEGVRPVVVHGGGPVITHLLAAHHLESHFVDGHRITSDDAMDVVAMALSLVHLRVVAGLSRRGLRSRGVTGVDRGLLVATVPSQHDRTARAVRVDPDVIVTDDEGVIVVNPLAVGDDGELANCNADMVAGALAQALRADALILLSDVDQVRADPDEPSSAIRTIRVTEIADLVTRGVLRDGMRPKLAAAACAVEAGASRVIIANGTRPHALVRALHRDGLFTEVTS